MEYGYLKKMLVLGLFIFSIGSFASQKDTEVVLIEYFDFSCPLSAKGAKVVFSLKENFPKRIKVVRKSLAFSDGEFSSLAGKYFHVLDAQSKELGKRFYESMVRDFFNLGYFHYKDEFYLQTVAKKLGTDMERLKKDLISPKLGILLKKNQNEAKKHGIFISPGYLVNGAPLLGKQDKESFVVLINKTLKKNYSL